MEILLNIYLVLTISTAIVPIWINNIHTKKEWEDQDWDGLPETDKLIIKKDERMLKISWRIFVSMGAGFILILFLFFR
jgi:hypothetical protein